MGGTGVVAIRSNPALGLVELPRPGGATEVKMPFLAGRKVDYVYTFDTVAKSVDDVFEHYLDFIQAAWCDWQLLDLRDPRACYVRSVMDDEGGACDTRMCPEEIAWVDTPIGENQGHRLAECAGRGICDRATGDCLCFPGFEGEDCSTEVDCGDGCKAKGNICLFGLCLCTPFIGTICDHY